MKPGNLLAKIFYEVSEPLLAPLRWFGDQFQESPRKRALAYGLPAILVACTGLALLVAAQLRRDRELLTFYNSATSKLEKEIAEKATLFNNSRQQIEKPAATVPEEGATASEPTATNNATTADKPDVSGQDSELQGLTAEQKQIVQQIRSLQVDLQTMLLKLISLEPINQTYRYRYANSFASTDPMKQFELMRQLAPESNSGYADAHFWLAANLMRARANNLNERRLLLEKALVHANFCLTSDSKRRDARVIKANALFGLGRQQEAYVEFEQLFQDEPEFFDSLVKINSSMRMEQRNRAVYEDAALRLENKLKAVRDTDIDSWARTLRQIQLCYTGSGNFFQLRRLLEVEQQLAQDNPLRAKAIEEVLAASLNAEAQSLVRSDTAAQRMAEILKLLKQAYDLDPRAVQTKYQLTYIATTVPEAAAEAKAIYDAEQDSEIPGQVLQVLGNAEMQKRNYSAAIEQYEQARLKQPKDSDLLNNLAYAYLVSDTKNAERALFLVDEAIQSIPPTVDKNDVASHFYHTRGTALLALDRVSEAAASFELALQSRPDNPGILESLVKCYRGRDEKQAAAYQRRLDAVSQKPSQQKP